MSRARGPPMVLHVDDDQDFLDLTETFLARRAEDFDLLQATSATAALDLLADREVDCVVSDYDMPGTDGIEFLEAVRESYPDLPFVLFTGKGSEEIAAEAISAGVTDYLQKRGGTEQFALLANRIENAAASYAARREAAKTQERLSRVYERITDGFFAIDEDWTYTYVNDAGAELVGLSPEELEGQRTWEVFPELDESPFGEALRAAMATQETQAIEEYYPAHDRWYTVTIYPSADGLSVYFRDVTERKERERHQRLMEHVLESVDDGVVIVRDGVFEFANPRFVEMSGYEEAEIHGMDMEELVTPEYRELIRERHQARLEGEAEDVPDVYEVELLRADGDTLLVEVNVSVFEYEGDPATVTILRDVSDRAARQARVEALHDATRDLMRAETRQEIAEVAVETTRDILDMPINGVMLHDEDTDTLDPVAASDAARSVIGELPTFEPEDSLAWQVYESGEVGVFEDVSTEPDRLNPETPIRSEIILPLGDHGVMNIGSTEVDAFDETDVALARTLAANMRAAMRRADREAELAEQNERLEEFTRIVSHDLRSPLSVAAGHLELAAADDTGSEQHVDDTGGEQHPDDTGGEQRTADAGREEDHLATARQAIERMEALVDELLTVAREGERDPEPEELALADVARRSWENVATEGITLEVATERRVRGDPLQLQQLLENLFINAVDHAGSEGTVVVADAPGGFAVADDGPGVPPEHTERIFESGFSTTSDGTGYGLSIVADIASAHGWEVTVAESDQGGARFEFTGVETD